MISWDDNPVYSYLSYVRWRFRQWVAIACIPALGTVLACAAGIVLSRGVPAVGPGTIFMSIALISLIGTHTAFLVSTADPLSDVCRDKAGSHLVLTGLTPENWLAGHLLGFGLDWLTVAAMHGPLFGMAVWAGYTTSGHAAWAYLLVGVTVLNVHLLRLSYWRMELVHWAVVMSVGMLGWVAALMIYATGTSLQPGTFSDLSRIWSALCPVMALLSLFHDAFVAGIPALGQSLSYRLSIGPWRVSAGSAVLCLLANGVFGFYLAGCIVAGPRRQVLSPRHRRRRFRGSHSHSGRLSGSIVNVPRLLQENALALCRHADAEIALVWTLAWLVLGAGFALWVAVSLSGELAGAFAPAADRPLWLLVCFTIALAAAPVSCFRRSGGAGFPPGAVWRHQLLALLTGLSIGVVAFVLSWVTGGGWGVDAGVTASGLRTAGLVLLAGLGATAIAVLASCLTRSVTRARLMAVGICLIWCVVPIWLGSTWIASGRSAGAVESAAAAPAGALLSLSPLWHVGASIQAVPGGVVFGIAWFDHIGMGPETYARLSQPLIFAVGAVMWMAAAGLALRLTVDTNGTAESPGGEGP